MAKLGTLTLKGASGKSYDFNVYSSGGDWKEGVACVYYVSKRTKKSDGSGNHTHIYVGETEDLKDRMASHHKQACFDKHNYNAVSVHRKSGGASARQTVEQDLIKALKPPCND